MTIRSLATIALAAAAVTAASSASADPRRPPTFGATVEAVNINVSVTDARNRYVTDLGRDDFEVLEDGVPQQLTLFTRDDVPISLVLMIDGSSSMEDKLRTAQQAAVRFIGTLRPQDSAEVIQFNQRATTLQPFTSDHHALEAAIRRTTASGMTALHTALYVTLRELVGQGRSEELRRRAIVLLTDGEDTASSVSDEQVLDLARKCEINVYTVRLNTATADPYPTHPASDQAEYLLKALARDTGGGAYFPAALRELDAVYGRIAQELRTLYTVGYASSRPLHDGKWRRILVRLPHRVGLMVRHKVGYYAPSEPAALRGADSAAAEAAERALRAMSSSRPPSQ